MTIGMNIETLIVGLSAVAMLLATVYALWRWSRVRRLRRYVSAEGAREYCGEADLPTVSVVVYASEDAAGLERNLPLLLSQRYPKPYEVIVVNDGAWDNSGDVVSAMMAVDSRLRLTFAPREARGLSRKKLSLMIGVKAAKGSEVVVITNANCEPASDEWLLKICRGFVAGVDVVAGYSVPCYAEDRGLWHRYRVWDTVRVGMQYVNSAVKGKMYRGTSDNLAFRREAFFAHGGYARSLGLKWGEDDVWLRSVVKRGNARMELAAESLMTAHYDDPKRAHKELKLRRDFTSRFVRRKQFLVDGLMSAMNYGRVCALVAAVALAAATGNWWLLGAVAALWLCAMCVNISLYNKEARLLHAPRLIANVPLQALWTPVVNLRYRMAGRKARRGYYTTTLE